MPDQQHRIRFFLLVASLISIMTGCTSQGINSRFTVKVSGNTDGLSFDGQCTAQKAEFWHTESDAQSLDIEGTVISISEPQEYETTGHFIYCSVANQSTTGTITIELYQDGSMVASAQSTSPEKPAILEFGQKP